MAKEWPVEWCSIGTLLTNDAGELHLRLSSVQEAKLTIKALRIRKKELNAAKRENNQKMAAIRRDYAARNARRGPSVRGMGGFGKFIRSMDQLGRANARSSRENELAPLEQWKRELEGAIHTLDLAIHHCELYIHNQEVEQLKSGGV